MEAHTHWRLYIGAKSNVYAQMGTVSFLNAAQVNQSTGGTATASSEYDGSWAAGKAFDGNPASEWASTGVSGSEWIAYQHPSPVDIVFVGVKVSTSYPVSGLALQYSDDGVSWSAASPLYLLAGQPALTSGSYTVLGVSASRRPLVLVDGRAQELPEGDTLPPQAPAAHVHATSDVTGLDAALSGKEPTISAGTTAQYWRGDKSWRDFFTDVRAATLTGLSTATNAAIAATDTVLTAPGKLQAQISGITGVNGLLKSNGTTVSAAAAGTDYVAPGGALGTPASGDLSNCTADGTAGVGFKNIPQNSQSAAYTLVLADSGRHILHPGADTTARTFTIPANSAVAYPVGTAITFVNQSGAGVVTISITADTMRLAGAGTTGSRTLEANGVATALKITTTEWIISGSGLT